MASPHPSQLLTSLVSECETLALLKTTFRILQWTLELLPWFNGSVHQ